MSGNAVGARGFPHRRDNSNQLEALGADATVGPLRRDVVPLGAQELAAEAERRARSADDSGPVRAEQPRIRGPRDEEEARWRLES